MARVCARAHDTVVAAGLAQCRRPGGCEGGGGGECGITVRAASAHPAQSQEQKVI